MEALKKFFHSEKLYFAVIIFCIVLGVALRLCAFSFPKDFYFDEAALALNVIERNNPLDFLKLLDYEQACPFLFLIISKISISIFGINEWAFRLFPLICGIGSVFGFYFLSKEVLKTKVAVIAANYLFAVNWMLIVYCKEFKQYSGEVLVAILLILFLSKLDLKEMSKRKCTAVGLLCGLLFLITMAPSPLIFASFILYFFVKNIRISKRVTVYKIACIVIPFLLIALPYYFICLRPERAMMESIIYGWAIRGYYSFDIDSVRQCIDTFSGILFTLVTGFMRLCLFVL